jgi:hypothetical protein
MTKEQARGLLKRAYAAFAAESMVFLVAYLAIIVGLPILLNPGIFAPMSIQSGMPEWLVRIWGVDLLAGGMLSVSGLVSERPRIERAGLALLCAGAAIYAGLIILFGGWASLLPSLTYVLFAWSAALRYRKLGQVLSAIQMADDLQNPSCDK